MKRKRKYTEAVHARRVQKVIEKKEVCECCPAQKSYRVNTGNRDVLWRGIEDRGSFRSTCCIICNDFVGLKLIWSSSRRFFKCPCDHCGKEEAIKRTRQALEEKGYL